MFECSKGVADLRLAVDWPSVDFVPVNSQARFTLACNLLQTFVLAPCTGLMSGDRSSLSRTLKLSYFSSECHRQFMTLPIRLYRNIWHNCNSHAIVHLLD
jgi:hypothetical protein